MTTMATIPGWNIEEVLEVKREVQLAVHGRNFDYIPRSGPNYMLRACIGETQLEGREIYFVLWAKPESFQGEPAKGDSLIVDRKEYVVERLTKENGWYSLLCHFQRYL